ncbi:MAG: ATP pyrophosphatase, partial [Candidatus Omnitrophica bacterium]|nr:ATP pyrophosphatase [Candidatus Omnitrophota bacterium]
MVDLMKNRIAACSWSSGKDSCLSLYRAIQKGYKIVYLFNFISYEYGRVSFHGTKSNLVKLQAEALDISLIQKETTKDNYDEVFRKTLKELKEMNINQIVRGDIHLQDLQDW